ncbi:MAG TPA: tripartite tricarboxylate transporter substrate binding protein [Alphaproteobacteria bacterium]
MRRVAPRVLILRLALVLLGLSAAGAHAESYPSRPVRVIVTAAAGGTTDFLARWIGKGFTEQTGQPFIVENRGGAGGNVGGELVAKSTPDGYTLAMVASGAIVINPWLYEAMPYDPLTDLVPVLNVGSAPQFLIVPASIPAKTLQEFIALAKSRPGQFNYASAGNGSTTHLALDHFARLAGIQLVHIPYRGVGAAVADLVAGRVQMLSTSIPPVRAQLDAGEVRALCLAAPRRLSVMPDVPTAAEAGLPGYDMTTWFAFLAPRGTDPAIVEFLNRHFQKTLDDPETRRRFEELGVEPLGGSPASFAATIKADAKYWEPIVKASGAKAE